MFNLVFKTLARDRKIKLKIYPMIGYFAIFGFIFIFREQHSLDSIRETLTINKYHLGFLYMPIMILQVALHEIPYSDDFKASWVYFSAPIGTPGELLSGMIKAIFARLFVVVYAVITVIVVIVMGPSSIADIIVAAINNYLMFLILARIEKHKLPLSLAHEVRGQSGNITRGIIALLMLGAVTAIHYVLLSFLPALIFALVPVQLVVCYFLHQEYKSITWDDITL